MSNFKDQINEDLLEYSENYPNMRYINDKEWAFNFWVLDKLFSVDEEVIEDYITDKNDKGIDCYVWHQDSHDLYIIQNKYYSENTLVTKEYIMNDFLTRSIGALEKGTYNRCKDLQDIYTQYSGEDDFDIHFHIYVTNNSSKTKAVEDALFKYNRDNASKHREVKFFSLDDIEQAFYDEPIENKKSFTYKIKSINKATILSINNREYETKLITDAKFALTPILTIYNMYKEAKEKRYSLFDENIREYLGSSGTVNKKIKATLNNSEERNNFFYYNNGITMIADKLGKEETVKGGREFEVINPQIVNGCQTVSTIFETLSVLPQNSLEEDFKHVYVMLKVLEIPRSEKESEYKELYDNIVRYNNSQNSINEKAFEANEGIFKRVKTEFEAKGFLVCLKQSDKYTYKQEYKTPTKLKDKNSQLLKRYGLDDLNKTTDFIIDLEKLLQVFLAFESTPVDAIQNKSHLLKHDSVQNKIVIDFIKNPDVTSNDWVALYLLYFKTEKLRKTKEKAYLNPFYVVYCFSRYECNEREDEISQRLNTKDDIDKILKKYNNVLYRYYKRWLKNNEDKGYNDMIKSPIDLDLLDDIVDDVKFEIIDEDM